MKRVNVNDNWLGACRGLAVLGVFLTHFLPYINNAFGLHSHFINLVTVEIIDVGKIGVAMLFLIAGYLAPTSKKKRGGGQFLMNRFFRLYPTYWLDIVLVGIFFAFDGYKLDTILANLTMLQVFLGKEDLVGLFWTLPIELMLYIFCILFERFIWNYKYLKALELIGVAGTIILAIIRNKIWPKAPVAIGLLLTIALLGHAHRLYTNKTLKIKQLILLIVVFIIGLIITSILAYQVDTGYHETWYRYVLSYILAIAGFNLFMHIEYKSKLLTMLATISYPFYLLQEIVHRIAFKNIWTPGMNEVVFSITTITLLIFVSFIVHLIIENPMIKIGNIIERRIFQKH